MAWQTRAHATPQQTKAIGKVLGVAVEGIHGARPLVRSSPSLIQGGFFHFLRSFLFLAGCPLWDTASNPPDPH
eukprot:1152300-Pelagomonas_calceolata.AAC.1